MRVRALGPTWCCDRPRPTTAGGSPSCSGSPPTGSPTTSGAGCRPTIPAPRWSRSASGATAREHRVLLSELPGRRARGDVVGMMHAFAIAAAEETDGRRARSIRCCAPTPSSSARAASTSRRSRCCRGAAARGSARRFLAAARERARQSRLPGAEPDLLRPEQRREAALRARRASPSSTAATIVPHPLIHATGAALLMVAPVRVRAVRPQWPVAPSVKDWQAFLEAQRASCRQATLWRAGAGWLLVGTDPLEAAAIAPAGCSIPLLAAGVCGKGQERAGAFRRHG